MLGKKDFFLNIPWITKEISLFDCFLVRVQNLDKQKGVSRFFKSNSLFDMFHSKYWLKFFLKIHFFCQSILMKKFTFFLFWSESAWVLKVCQTYMHPPRSPRAEALQIGNAGGALVFLGKFSVFCIPSKKISNVTSCLFANCLI